MVIFFVENEEQEGKISEGKKKNTTIFIFDLDYFFTCSDFWKVLIISSHTHTYTPTHTQLY
jgi:hypothetical protein